MNGFVLDCNNNVLDLSQYVRDGMSMHLPYIFYIFLGRIL